MRKILTFDRVTGNVRRMTEWLTMGRNGSLASRFAAESIT